MQPDMKFSSVNTFYCRFVKNPFTRFTRQCCVQIKFKVENIAGTMHSITSSGSLSEVSFPR